MNHPQEDLDIAKMYIDDKIPLHIMTSLLDNNRNRRNNKKFLLFTPFIGLFMLITNKNLEKEVNFNQNQMFCVTFYQIFCVICLLFGVAIYTL